MNLSVGICGILVNVFQIIVDIFKSLWRRDLDMFEYYNLRPKYKKFVWVFIKALIVKFMWADDQNGT